MIGDLLKRGLERISRFGRPDPGAPRPELEEQLRAIFEEYGAQVRGEDEAPKRPGMWIFRQGVDHERFLQAAVAVVDDALANARYEGFLSASSPDPECACVCREHRQRACPLCIRVEQCSVHGEDDPARVSPRWRREHG